MISPTPGLYHYLHQAQDERSRIHLRVDTDGSGLLMVNASRVLQLNSTATMMAYLFLERVPEKQAIKLIRKRYHVPKSQASSDFNQTAWQLGELIRPDGACPLHELDLDVTAPFQAQLSAPYRMDLALTYRCNNDCSHCYNARPRNYPELDTQTWKLILDKLWNLGIPHIVFTGGEPTLRSDLAELIAHAESNGQITGLNTNGRRLADADYLDLLVSSGLDHVQITLESHNPEIHDQMVKCNGAWRQTTQGIKNALTSNVFVMTNTTMLENNSPALGKTLDYLAELGVPTIGLNALIHAGRGTEVTTGLREKELEPLLQLAREKTERAGQRLIWYTPTEYCHFDPVQLDLGVKGCTAALYNMCVEPDGRVLPCQSYYQPIGSLLTDSWDSIWNHDLSRSLRDRRYISERCKDCGLVAECGGGCPLKGPESWQN